MTSANEPKIVKNLVKWKRFEKCKQNDQAEFTNFLCKITNSILEKNRENDMVETICKQTLKATIWHFLEVILIFWWKLLKFDNTLVQTLAVVKISKQLTERKIWK